MMQQISVFLGNNKGRLADVTALLAENNINLLALSIADTTSFGILRMIVEDSAYVLQVLKQGGYTASIAEVLALLVPHIPGGLAKVMGVLSKGGIPVEYAYSANRTHEGLAVILCKVETPEEAILLLKKENIKYLSQNEVASLG